MPQMTMAQARVVDPVLTTLAQGYKQPGFVGSLLFPTVYVDLSGGQVIEFGKEAFQQYSTARAPGVRVAQVQFGYLGKPYALENHGLEGVLPLEIARDAQNYPGIDLAQRALNLPLRSLSLSLELQQATIATNAANYDANHKVVLSGTSKFSDPSATPIKAIDTYKEAVRSSVGVYPNLAVFSPSAWTAFKNNPEVTSRITYSNNGVLSESLAASLLGIKQVVVAEAVHADNNGTFSDVWGDNIVLAYSNLGSLGAEEPSFAYTYTMRGNPLAEPPRYEAGLRSWVYPVFYERVPVLSGITAGFLVQGAA